MRAAAALALWFLLSAAAPAITFTPLEPRFAATAAWYRGLWAAEGERIVAALERHSGFAFPDRPLEIILRDARPMAGNGCNGIRLRGTYTGPVAVGTLIHELGHCLTATMPRSIGLDDHRLLYLFLYDAWTDLYGPGFADRMVRLERRIPGGYDYAAAWDWALAMTREERRARLRALTSAPPPARPPAGKRQPDQKASSGSAIRLSAPASSLRRWELLSGRMRSA